jgi:hypothetical protein
MVRKGKSPGFGRGFLISVLSIAGRVELIGSGDVICFVLVMGDGGLTRFFMALGNFKAGFPAERVEGFW